MRLCFYQTLGKVELKKKLQNIKAKERVKKRENLALGDDATAFLENGRGEEDLFADHGVVFVVGVVSISELPIRPELELQKLVPEFPFMPHVVTEVKLSAVLLGRHCFPSLFLSDSRLNSKVYKEHNSGFSESLDGSLRKYIWVLPSADSSGPP